MKETGANVTDPFIFLYPSLCVTNCEHIIFNFSWLILQETVSSTNLTRVRRFQRELEAAEERAEAAETNLNMIRAKHRTLVTCQTTTLPGGETVVVKETVHQQQQ